MKKIMSCNVNSHKRTVAIMKKKVICVYYVGYGLTFLKTATKGSSEFGQTRIRAEEADEPYRLYMLHISQ